VALKVGLASARQGNKACFLLNWALALANRHPRCGRSVVRLLNCQKKFSALFQSRYQAATEMGWSFPRIPTLIKAISPNPRVLVSEGASFTKEIPLPDVTSPKERDGSNWRLSATSALLVGTGIAGIFLLSRRAKELLCCNFTLPVVLWPENFKNEHRKRSVILVSAAAKQPWS